jgi:hypothetical protein
MQNPAAFVAASLVQMSDFAIGLIHQDQRIRIRSGAVADPIFVHRRDNSQAMPDA